MKRILTAAFAALIVKRCPYCGELAPSEQVEKPIDYCQHDVLKPAPTLRPTFPREGRNGEWVQEYRCNVCQCRFELPIATASASSAKRDCAELQGDECEWPKCDCAQPSTVSEKP